MRTGNRLMLALAALSTLGATGCVVRETAPAYGGQVYASGQVSGTVAMGDPGYTYVQTLPPDPIYEEITPAPAYGYVWIDGYWHWSGWEWLWLIGHWEA